MAPLDPHGPRCSAPAAPPSPGGDDLCDSEIMKKDKKIAQNCKFLQKPYLLNMQLKLKRKTLFSYERLVGLRQNSINKAKISLKNITLKIDWLIQTIKWLF